MFKIETITAYVAVDEDGEEGILGAKMGNTWMPLVCADEKRSEQMYLLAKDICTIEKKEFKALRFSVRTDVTEEIKKKYD